MRRIVALVVVGLALMVPSGAAAQSNVTVSQARQAIHHADAYAFIGQCHRTRYSVVCKVAHEIEARTETGSPGTATIYLIDRVHRVGGRLIVSTIWEGTVSVGV